MCARQQRRVLLGAAAMLLAAGGVAAAQNRIEISRGPDSVIYGSCVPVFRAVNNTTMVVDYLELGLSFTLKSGESRALEFRSRYREGIERPIQPGATVELKVQPDLSRPLGADCADIVAINVIDAICEAQGKTCGGVISVDTGKR